MMGFYASGRAMRRRGTPWISLLRAGRAWRSRTGNAGLHDFDELLVIALCAVLCGRQGAVDMAVRQGERAIPARLSEARKRGTQR